MNQRRNTLDELICMKKNILEQCLHKEMKCKDGAVRLAMHPKAFLRLKKRYEEGGEGVLIPQKPGPKHFQPKNKTPEWIEDIVVELAEKKKR